MTNSPSQTYSRCLRFTHSYLSYFFFARFVVEGTMWYCNATTSIEFFGLTRHQ
ncbi:hypothetical protein [cyanobacterium endosymbiont of Rhopalodia gibberula]|uniref:hypothetical protein n=1 Tax=cyanobacterium endosymbiont of Rhopalodia gibberula TaxID=1763363 RepID=UPI003B83962F